MAFSSLCSAELPGNLPISSNFSRIRIVALISITKGSSSRKKWAVWDVDMGWPQGGKIPLEFHPPPFSSPLKAVGLVPQFRLNYGHINFPFCLNTQIPSCPISKKWYFGKSPNLSHWPISQELAECNNIQTCSFTPGWKSSGSMAAQLRCLLPSVTMGTSSAQSFQCLPPHLDSEVISLSDDTLILRSVPFQSFHFQDGWSRRATGMNGALCRN